MLESHNYKIYINFNLYFSQKKTSSKKNHKKKRRQFQLVMGMFSWWWCCCFITLIRWAIFVFDILLFFIIGTPCAWIVLFWVYLNEVIKKFRKIRILRNSNYFNWIIFISKLFCFDRRKKFILTHCWEIILWNFIKLRNQIQTIKIGSNLEC
jgi:hypothetical protein